MNKAAAALFVATISGMSLVAQGPPPEVPGFGPGPIGAVPPGPAVTGVPFSGIESIQMQRTLADGNDIENQHQTKIYRDTQGRVRTEDTVTTPSGRKETVIRIFDPVGGYEVTLNSQDSTAIKHVLPASAADAETPPRPPAGMNSFQSQTQDLGTKTISGLSATGMQVSITIPVGAIGNTQSLQIVRQIWTATALKIPVLVINTDPRSGTSTMQLENISQAEPDAALFQIPSTYSVMTESAPGPGGPPFNR